MRMLVPWFFAVSMALQAQAQPQAFPQRPIRMVVPAAPGTATDTVARFASERLGRELGGAVAVENKVGANGIIGIDFVAKAPADGYTLLASPSPVYVNKALYAKVPYEPIADFVPLAKAASAYLVLVVPAASPYQTLKDLVDFMRANPGKLSYASGGTGSVTHMAPALLVSMAGVQAVHVPYKGSDGATTDTISGQVAFSFPAVAGALPHIQSGRLRALAVYGARRSSALPNVPALTELGFPIDIATSIGFMAPRNVPEAIRVRVSEALLKILRSDEFTAFAKAQGLELDVMNAEEYGQSGLRELAHWEKAVAAIGGKQQP